MRNNKKSIMILGAGEIQEPVIRKSVSEGYYTIAVDYNPDAPGFQYADKGLLISTHNKKEILKAAKQYNIDGILTTSDFPVRVVAYVAEKMNLKALSVETANICTDKFLLRETLKKTALNHPKYVLAENKKDLSKVNFFPAVIKPVDASASRGVRKVNTKEELLKEYEVSRSFSISKKVIIEKYIDGREYSVETITYSGKTNIIAITQKIKTGEKEGYFVEYAHKLPADITKKDYELIKKTVLELINIVKLNNSSAHIEIILSGNEAYIVEIGARLGGDFITSDLVPLATGIDMLKNIIKISVNEDPDTNIKYNKYSGVQFVTSNNYNSAVEFIKKKRKSLIKYNLKSYKKNIVKNSLDRLGYIILQTSTKDKLDNLFKKINNEY